MARDKYNDLSLDWDTTPCYGNGGDFRHLLDFCPNVDLTYR